MLSCYLLTGSLIYQIKSEDYYEEFVEHKHFSDFSNFSKDSKFYDTQSEMVVGKMKAANKGIPVNKFIGLRSKMYFMLSGDGKESNTAKGVNFATDLNEFRDTLFIKKIIRHKMKRIQSKKHKLGTYEIKKCCYLVLMTKDLF